MNEMTPLLERAVARALNGGASAADAIAVDHTEASVRVRLGETEEITRARQRKLGLRVIIDGRQAISATSDLRAATLDALVDDTCAMARLTAADPAAGLADPEAVGSNDTGSEGLYDPASEDFDLREGARWAHAAEAAAMTDPRMTNSEGGNFGYSTAERTYVGSNGARGHYRSSSFGGWVIPIATADGAMECDYYYSARHTWDELESPESIGRKAAERTLRRLGARRAKTARVPVVFDQRCASALLGYLGGAVGGYSIYRGASYLAERLGETVAADCVTVVDDGGLQGGPASRPWDGEGVASRRNVVIDRGRLETFLCDTYSAKKLERHSTASAWRSVGDAPSAGPTNLHMQPGEDRPEALLDGIRDGFYVTELIGYGVNATSGDYSQGAAGLWIVDGKLSHAVHEVTIAGNLLTIFQDIEAVASDLDVHQAVSSPSFRVRELTVAGE